MGALKLWIALIGQKLAMKICKIKDFTPLSEYMKNFPFLAKKRYCMTRTNSNVIACNGYSLEILNMQNFLNPTLRSAIAFLYFQKNMYPLIIQKICTA
jgi:hypothetical protein